MGRKSPYRESVDERVSSAGDEDGGDALRPATAATEEGTRRHKKYKQNWRLNMLSVPKQVTQKFNEPEWKLVTGVHGDALNAECTDRTEQLALSGMRYLKVNKAMYTVARGPEYGKRMDDYIQKSWNSIYNYYRKSIHDLKKRKAEKQKIITHRWSNVHTTEKKGKKGKGKDKGGKISKKDSKASEKSKETLAKDHDQWCVFRSKPKILIKPPPVNRGPICDMDAIKPRQDEISLPKRVYRTPSNDSNFKDPTKVSPAALTYEASERIGELSQPTQHKKLEEMIPGAVKPAALTYEITDRVKQLAIPKPATTARESDLNEDAFTISPAALKYVATPRILEIAKPKEYSF